MKKSFAFLLLLTVGMAAFAQQHKYQLPARQTPVTKKEKLTDVQTINDLTPLLWSSMYMPSNERYWLDQRRPGTFPQPANFVYPQDDYKQILNVVSVEITTISNGAKHTAKSNSDKLTAEQKNLLTNADLGSDVSITLKYQYKNKTDDQYGPRKQTVLCTGSVTVVPETEAEFPGGFKQLADYVNTHIVGDKTEKTGLQKIERAAVKFIITEEGKVTDARLVSSTNDAAIDKLILDAFTTMPNWKPATNSKGLKVKQQIYIPFSVGC